MLEANNLVPLMWNLTKSTTGQGVKKIKSIIDQDVKRVKAELQYVKGINTFKKRLTKDCFETHLNKFSMNH